jgi:hypothetical protein
VCGGAAAVAAISFMQHFGNTLNYHPHFHLIVADGIFSGEDSLWSVLALLLPARFQRITLQTPS